MNQFRFIGALLMVVLFAACSTQRNIPKPLLNRSTAFLTEHMNQSDFDCEWLSTKLDVEFKTDKLSDSFKMHVRLRKDSAIWISTTYYAVEVARFLITPDTVKFMDRKANQYFVGEFDYINKRFDVSIDFKTMQAIILGNSVSFATETDKVKSYHKEGLYHLSSVGKLKKNKEEKDQKKEKDPRKEKELGVVYTMSLFPGTFRVAKLAIQDFDQGKSLFTSIEKHQTINEQLLPEKYALDIHADQKIATQIEYLKTSINKPVKLSFTIPEKYERIN